MIDQARDVAPALLGNYSRFPNSSNSIKLTIFVDSSQMAIYGRNADLI
jgi:hypothetical protein